MKAIYLIMGPSGSGKTAVADALESRYGLCQVMSYTTRPRRDGEGAGHLFITEEEFDRLPHLAACTRFCGFRYGATAKQIADADLYVIDPDGIRFFADHYDGEKSFRVIYLDVPESVCRARMAARGDAQDTIDQRAAYDREAFRDAEEMADVCIANRNFEQCVETVAAYILTNEWEEN